MAKARFGNAKQYAAAIAGALADAPEKHHQLLHAHVSAPKHTRTYTQLAKAVGYASFGAVNLQYGLLAHRVAENLGVFARPPEGFWGIVLVEWTGVYDPSGSRFRLRREVVEALDFLGFGREIATGSSRVRPASRARGRAAS